MKDMSGWVAAALGLAVALEGLSSCDYLTAGAATGNVAPAPVECAAGGCPVTLATGPVEPWALAIDATSVYWTTDDGRVMKVPQGGGTVTTLASGPLYPYSIAVDATSVYWGSAGDHTIRKVSLDGGAMTTLVTEPNGSGGPAYIAVDGTSVYWSDPDGIHKVPVAGGTAELLAQDELASSIALDATSVYWADGFGMLKKVSLAGGTVSTLVSGLTSGSQVFSIAVDATSVYLLSSLDQAGYEVPLDGGAVSTIASGLQGGAAVAVLDATSVYWSDHATILSLPLLGGTPTTLALAQHPTCIRVDATSLYWTNSDGTVMKLTPK